MKILQSVSGTDQFLVELLSEIETPFLESGTSLLDCITDPILKAKLVCF
jgi:hypothetical protein